MRPRAGPDRFAPFAPRTRGRDLEETGTEGVCLSGERDVVRTTA